jgi:hypothetical protein
LPVVCKTGRRVRKRGASRGVPESGGSAADPAMDAKGRPYVAETVPNTGSPPDLLRSIRP